MKSLFKKKEKQSSIKGVELSEIAKKYHIRVSAPQGYFPEDVDRILIDLSSQLEKLSKENKHAETRLTTVTAERDALKTEMTALKLQISTMEIPDTSTETDFHMLSRLRQINPIVGDLITDTPIVDKKEVIEPIISDKVETNERKTPELFDDLVSTNRIKLRNPKKNTTLDIIGGTDE